MYVSAEDPDFDPNELCDEISALGVDDDDCTYDTETSAAFQSQVYLNKKSGKEQGSCYMQHPRHHGIRPAIPAGLLVRQLRPCSHKHTVPSSVRPRDVQEDLCPVVNGSAAPCAHQQSK
jgi:hypothetical protein